MRRNFQIGHHSPLVCPYSLHATNGFFCHDFVRSRIQRLLSFCLLMIFSIFLPSCSGLERSEYEKVRKNNLVEDPISRNQQDREHVHMPPSLQASPVYPWDHPSCPHPKIRQEYFYCKGHANHLPYSLGGVTYQDCEGKQEHTLPLKEGKEHVYPILIDLLNYVQQETGKKVQITSGHRCPKHNAYADPSAFNRASKHQIGAEVDFYVEGMEHTPLAIVDLLMRYYKEASQTKGHSSYTSFKRYLGSGTNVKTPPWYNKEVFIKLYQKDEGRDRDNQHTFPYLAIQVRFDRNTEEKVTYSWEKAHKKIRFR